VLIQEVLGVNKNMRQTADDFAKAGYLLLVPDLYWRLEPNVQLDPEDKDDWAKAFELLKAFDLDSGVEDLKASLTFPDNSSDPDRRKFQLPKAPVW
jgi:carboxymethylenebutenolidase